MHMLKQEVADKITELVRPMDGQRIVEIGTGWGESAKHFSELKPTWTIYTIDAFGIYGDGRIYQEWNHERVAAINRSLGKNVIQILGDSSKVPWELPIDVLFIDGDHSYEGCKADYEKYEPWVREGGYIIFDDYTQDNNPINGVRRVCDELDLRVVHEGYYCKIFKR